MTDLLLAVVVVGAVITFGALISVGNERQRRAIDALHQAYKHWAVQDLRLKRGVAGSQIQIQDITAWLTKTMSTAFGHQITIMDYQFHNAPVSTIEFQDAESGNTIVCVLEPPDVLLPMLKKKSQVLRGELRSNPIFQVSKKTATLEVSLLNAGTVFDLELPVAWNALTGLVTEADILWAYILN